MRRSKGAAERNPLGLALGAAGVGFVVGLLLPTTRLEDEKLGPASDKVGEVARESVERGKQVAEESAQAAMETAKESAGRQGEELSSSLQDRLPSSEEQREEQQQSSA
jgi:hypothetical protein